MDRDEARARLVATKKYLEGVIKRDPEQEVTGMAVPVMDAVVAAAKQLLPNDAIANTVRDLISPEGLAEGEPVRAVDALYVVEQLLVSFPESLPQVYVSDLAREDRSR